MKTQFHNSIVLLLLTALPFLTIAQTAGKQSSVQITGEVLTPFNITTSTLNEFEQVSVVRKDKDGNNHTYSGVEIFNILKKAGTTLNKELRGKNLTKYLLIEASDGYQVIFALAELDHSFTDKKIILTTQMDGKPLPVADGPFRIIVQDEKLPARCIKQVTSLQIKFAK